MAKDYSHGTFHNVDFSNQNLTEANFSDSVLIGCNFNSCDLSYATFERANCSKSSFQMARMYHTNFKDANLGFALVEPRDILGSTFTLNCATFEKMHLSTHGTIMVLYFLLRANIPEKLKAEIKKIVLDEIGQTKFDALERIFAIRQI